MLTMDGAATARGRACAWGLALALMTLGCATTAAPTHSLCPASVEAIDAAAARTLAQGSPGMVVSVAREGEVVFARGYGFADLEHRAAVTPDTVFRLASVTKQFTAAAVLLLVEDGRLNLDDRLSEYVPELQQASEVTLYQLLAQTSGIPDYAEDPEGGRTKALARSTSEMVEWIGRLEPRLHFEPGARWAYSNSNYALLGAVIERVSGQSLQDFFAERLFARAGLTHTSFDDPADVVPNRAAGYRRSRAAPSGFVNADAISWTIPGAAGGLRTTAGDLIRWSDALFGGRIVSPASLEAMTSPARLSDGRTTKLGMPEAWQAGLNSDYGFGVFISPSDAGQRIWHSGDMDGFSTWLGHYPEAGVTIALMQNSESADLDEAAIEDAVIASLVRGCGVSSAP